MCMRAICCCHNGWFALARFSISRAKFDDVDDCAIEIIVACLHVGVPIVSLLCTHCVHANRVEQQHRERSPFNYVDLPQSYACRKSTAQQRESSPETRKHKTQTTRRCVCVCCLENTHLESLPLFIRKIDAEKLIKGLLTTHYNWWNGGRWEILYIIELSEKTATGRGYLCYNQNPKLLKFQISLEVLFCSS